MQLVNPLYYPIAVLVGGIALVIGVRIAQLPSVVMLPVAAGIATAGASWLKSREAPEPFDLSDAKPERELHAVRIAAELLADKATALRLEATKLLTESFQLELLATIQYACDRASEIPVKIDEVAKRLNSDDSLLSIDELQQQLTQVQHRLSTSTGVTQEHLTQLAQTLQRNITLVQQGQDARQAQVTSLSTLIQNAAGVLQQLQNKLRTVDLTDSTQTLDLRSLSEELNSLQANVDLLISR